jgi:predicted permease
MKNIKNKMDHKTKEILYTIISLIIILLAAFGLSFSIYELHKLPNHQNIVISPIIIDHMSKDMISKNMD